MNNNQNSPKKGRGGARPNSGRKHGSTQKLSAQRLLQEIARKDKPFAIGLAEDYHNARMGDDKHLVMKYQQMILSKVVADKVDVDHTSLGESLRPIYNFNKNELTEWSPVYTLTNEQKD